MLIDDAAARATNGAWTHDVDGALAAAGRVDGELLAELLSHPYFRLPPPKTTGRELFGAQMGARIWEQGMRRSLRGEDVVATLTALTARSVARAYQDFLPTFPCEVIVSGGGARNATLMAMLRQALAEAHPEQPPRVLASEELGLPVEAKEAVAFAVLAYETWHGRPGNDPAATGARSPVVLGDITLGRLWPAAPPLPILVPHAEGKPLPGERASGLPVTETRNPATESIDALGTLEMVRLMNEEDSRVAGAVAEVAPAVAQAIDLVAERMRRGGRLIYVGAGTSGRLGALDAAEAPPTFGVPRGVVVALQAGGAQALTEAIEGAEDDAGAGAHDIAALNVTALDSVIGIAASGRTPYVLGALTEAKRRGALVVGLVCARPSALETLADLTIAPAVGPEVITGSTRLKAGTAQKMVLNMLSTGVMIRLGKTYGNLMVDVQPTNAKLRERARRIVLQACDSAGKRISDEEAAAALEAAGGEVKTAIVSLLLEVTADDARRRLSDASGSVRAVLGQSGR
jgi:N-acetylmuramic acid 6-phosphate etherase